MNQPSLTDIAGVAQLEYRLPVYDTIKGTYGIDIADILFRRDIIHSENQNLREMVADQSTLIQKLLAHKQVKLPKKRNT